MFGSTNINADASITHKCAQLSRSEKFFQEEFDGVTIQLYVCDALVLATLQSELRLPYSMFLFH